MSISRLGDGDTMRNAKVARPARSASGPAILLVATVLALASSVACRVDAQDTTARDVVDRAENAVWGKTLRAQLTMTVATPRWQRTLELEAWIARPRRSFIRILAPVKEAGIASLRIGAEMWNYLPTVERTIKIPPSMIRNYAAPQDRRLRRSERR